MSTVKKDTERRFTIYLPVAESHATENLNDPYKLLEGNETILLVDDEETIIDVSREILEALGYTVYSAMSGKEAIELYTLKKNEIDLVILDMIIPEMGGGEIFDALKTINPDVNVILSSGYSNERPGLKDHGTRMPGLYSETF